MACSVRRLRARHRARRRPAHGTGSAPSPSSSSPPCPHFSHCCALSLSIFSLVSTEHHADAITVTSLHSGFHRRQHRSPSSSITAIVLFSSHLLTSVATPLFPVSFSSLQLHRLPLPLHLLRLRRAPPALSHRHLPYVSLPPLFQPSVVVAPPPPPSSSPPCCRAPPSFPCSSAPTTITSVASALFPLHVLPFLCLRRRTPPRVAAASVAAIAPAPCSPCLTSPLSSSSPSVSPHRLHHRSTASISVAVIPTPTPVLSLSSLLPLRPPSSAAAVIDLPAGHGNFSLDR